MKTRLEIWLKGLLAAAISGAAGGVLTGLAAVGIDPQRRRRLSAEVAFAGRREVNR